MSTNSRRVVVGIDEAGRGSLVGDLFVAGIALGEGQDAELSRAGVRDSKTLGRSKRYRLLSRIIGSSDLIVVCRIVPEDIDRENINDLEVMAVERILRHAKSRGLNPTRVVVDEIAGRRESIERITKTLFPGAEVIMKPKADRDYVQASAASIVAKCLRDGLVRILSSRYGEIGSGYPSDPRTVEWLKRVTRSGTTPCCVRKSWKTFRRAQVKTLEMYAKKGKGGG